MAKQPPQDGDGFKVVCAWCGAFIRPAASKDSERMCSDCYRRLLEEHIGHRRHAGRIPEASER